MRGIAIVSLLLCAVLDAAASTPPGFSTPILPAAKSSACGAGNTAFVFAPDHSVISLLRQHGALLQTGSRAATTARCRIGLVVTRPVGSGAVLRIDLRGAEQKSARSALTLTIMVGASHHIATYPAGELLDGGPVARRFEVAVAAGTSTVWLDIAAKGRRLDGKDGVLVSLDSIDACFVDRGGTDACTPVTPPVTN